MMWMFIWVVLSLFILGVFLWSVLILREQKHAWAAFAKKHNLQYTAGKLMDSPTVRGYFGGYTLSLFSQTQQTDDVRGERYVSVIEVEMGPGLKTGAALGTEEMQAFINGLSFTETYVPKHEKWKPAFVLKARNSKILESYLNPTRLDALMDLFNMNKVSALFFFDEQDCVLHLETADPLRRADKLERIAGRILTNVQKLAPTAPDKKQNPDEARNGDAPAVSSDVPSDDQSDNQAQNAEGG
jgi:hypothetical protein